MITCPIIVTVTPPAQASQLQILEPLDVNTFWNDAIWHLLSTYTISSSWNSVTIEGDITSGDVGRKVGLGVKINDRPLMEIGSISSSTPIHVALTNVSLSDGDVVTLWGRTYTGRGWFFLTNLIISTEPESIPPVQGCTEWKCRQPLDGYAERTCTANGQSTGESKLDTVNCTATPAPAPSDMCYRGWKIHLSDPLHPERGGSVISPAIPVTGYISGDIVFIKGRIDYYNIDGDQC